ncbi:hypothetical protein NCC78_28035 [Micromonospora phytophila]|uniref:hypothetical protein n=1 Tax=Micromonospora phytophila TaxID=709888 RepID=UPI002030DD26|nr:hypothetical protein [Micromonospora phytophila]MCM0678495.1 hypothetical protein [Micromonospora phytophila]
MAVRLLEFLSILTTALALVPAGAHLIELPAKVRLTADEYLVVQKIYRGWELAGIVVIASIASTAALAVMVHPEPAVFALAATALGCLLMTQVVFWTRIFPVNRRTEQWTSLPAEWTQLRRRWEYGHAANALLSVAALTALVGASLVG